MFKILIAAIALACAAGCVSGAGSSRRNAQIEGAVRTLNYSFPQTQLILDVAVDTAPAPPGWPADVDRFTISSAEATLVHTDTLHYTLQYRPSSGSADDVTEETDEHGFLKSISFNRDDRTSEILAQGSSLIRTLVTGLPTEQRDSTRGADEEPFIRLPLNPEDPESLRDVNLALQPYQLSLDVIGGCPAQGDILPAVNATSSVIYYARQTPRLLRLSRGGNVIGVIEYETTNCGAGVLDIADYDWVNSELSLTFVSGVLTTVTFKKPSETEEAITALFSPVNAVLGIATDLVTVRIKDVDTESDILTAEAALLQARATYLQRERELLEAVEESQKDELPEDERAQPPQGADGVP